MGVPIQGEDLVIDRNLYQNSMNQVPQSTWNVWSATFSEAISDNPIPAIYRMSEMMNARGDEFKRIGQEDFENRYGSLGLRWDPKMTWEAASLLSERKKRELQNQFVMSGGKGGLLESSGVFGSQLVASFLDPVNIALAFLPVVAAPKYAQMGSKIGQRLSRGLIQAPRLTAAAEAGSTWSRVQIGMIEGFIGGGLVEPITFAARTQEQADYTMVDFLNNLMIGTFLGAGLHAGVGKVSDIYSNHKMRQVMADMRSTEIAAKQMLDGVQPDIGPLRTIDDAEIDIANDRLDVDDRAVESSVDVRAVDLDRPPDIEIVEKTKQGVFVRFSDDTGDGLTGFGSNFEKASSSLVSEYKRVKMEQGMNAARQDIAGLQSRLKKLVSERNSLRQARNGSDFSSGKDSIDSMKKKLKSLGSPDSLDIRLRELGYPIDAANELRTKSVQANQMHKRAQKSRGSGKKVGVATRAQAAKEAEAIYKKFLDENDRGRFVEAKEQLKRERNALRKQIRKTEVATNPEAASAKLRKVEKEINSVRKEIENFSIEEAQNSIKRMLDGDRRLFPNDAVPEKELLESKKPLTDEVSDADKALSELDEEIPIDLETLDPTTRKEVEDAIKFTKDIEALASAQRAGLECMTRTASGKV